LARDGAVYACQSCGAVQTKWSGQCSGCGAWNTLVEEVQARPPGALAPARGAAKGRGLNFEGLEDETPAPPRISTGVDEFDRVCGGGVVPGSAILLGGDPGVGKSTLLMQVAAHAARKGAACAYISGEEAVEQVRGRAQRMGLADAPVKLAAETSLRTILDGLKRERFDLVVVDPPRSGLHPTALAALKELAPAKLIYVSCNPKAMVEDIRKMSGLYDLRLAEGFDLFPHTDHMEAFAVLGRIY